MAFLPVDAAEAGSKQWTTTGPADAGPVISLAVDPSATETVDAGTGHAATLAGTVFKSTDGGASWVPANSGLPDHFIRALAIDPRTPSTIYAGTSGGVFKSVNGGGNWGGHEHGAHCPFRRRSRPSIHRIPWSSTPAPRPASGTQC